MRVSIPWLQTFFEKPLPKLSEVADALTFHVAEVEEIEGDSFEVNVLPDRAAYLLSHRGVAKELSAILNIPLKEDPLRKALEPFPKTDELSVTIEDPEKCSRYIGALMRGVKVGPSPDWLAKLLESVGQRSINNIVDATNYVMLSLGQPLHAFDAKKLSHKDGWHIAVRSAKEGEHITGLDDVEYKLSPERLVIADANADAPIGIAGVKGGKASGIDEKTTDIIVESANFDGTTVRRTAQALKLWTDASLRFQNRPSPELAAYGMEALIALIKDIAGGTCVGVVDVDESKVPEGQQAAYGAGSSRKSKVEITLERINGLLGSSYSEKDVLNVFDRLDLSHEEKNGVFSVTPPFERRDINIPEDLVEEAGRIMGYDGISPTMLPKGGASPDQRHFCGIERIKDTLIELGFTEISTPSFNSVGEIELVNPLDIERHYLRMDLDYNMTFALTLADRVAPLVLNDSPKLFEIGNVFPKGGEHSTVCLGISGEKSETILNGFLNTLKEELGFIDGAISMRGGIGDLDGYKGATAIIDLRKVDLEALGDGYSPKYIELGPYVPFSVYPFALRDIAVWVPKGTSEGTVGAVIDGAAGELLVRRTCFDVFEKDGNVSYAFHLVFQSHERTLSEEELNSVMDAVTGALEGEKGYQVR